MFVLNVYKMQIVFCECSINWWQISKCLDLLRKPSIKFSPHLCKTFKVNKDWKRTPTVNWEWLEHCILQTWSSAYTCLQCGMAFTHRSNLNRHMRSRAGIFSYTCQLCNKGFSSKDNLKGHMIVAHNVGEKLSCEICAKTFSYKKSLQDHVKIVHHVGSW